MCSRDNSTRSVGLPILDLECDVEEPDLRAVARPAAKLSASTADARETYSPIICYSALKEMSDSLLAEPGGVDVQLDPDGKEPPCGRDVRRSKEGPFDDQPRFVLDLRPRFVVGEEAAENAVLREALDGALENRPNLGGSVKGAAGEVVVEKARVLDPKLFLFNFEVERLEGRGGRVEDRTGGIKALRQVLEGGESRDEREAVTSHVR